MLTNILPMAGDDGVKKDPEPAYGKPPADRRESNLPGLKAGLSG